MAGVAIVTGAGSGIGRAAALALAGAGYRVALAGRRLEKLEETAAAAAAPNASLVAPTDVTDPREVARLLRATVTKFGRIDLLFNNAGIGAAAVPFEELSLDEWNRVVAVNLTGMFLCARETFGAMKRQQPQGGRIINNGSTSAHSPRLNSAAYTATKHAVTGLTKSIALDGRAFDITCGQIDIGNAATDLTKNAADGMPQAYGGTAVEPTFDVKHVAEAVLYMAGLPPNANVLSLTVMANKMPFLGRG